MAGKGLGKGKRVDGTGCPHRGGGGGRRARKVARAKRAVETRTRVEGKKEIKKQLDS
jgi:hypothetical protein